MFAAFRPFGEACKLHKQSEACTGGGPLIAPPTPTLCLRAHRIAEWRAEAPRRSVRRTPPSHARSARVPSQVCSLLRLECRLFLWLGCTTARTVLQVCGDAPRTVVRPSDGPTARTHATAPPAPLVASGCVPQIS